MPEQTTHVGDRIQKLRLKREMSIEEVEKKSGIPAATLASIEEGKSSPPLGTIILLARALHVTVGEVFGDSADAPFCIVRAEEQTTASRFGSSGTTSGGYSYKSLGHQKQNRHMEPFLVTLAPTEVAQAEPNQHEGEEILYVLEGQVRVRLADHTDILKPGDSIYYDSNLPHQVSCHGPHPARILAVIYAEKEMLIL